MMWRVDELVRVSGLVLALVFIARDSLADSHKVTVHAPTLATELPRAGRQLGDISYQCAANAGDVCNLANVFDRLLVCGLMVLKDGEIVLERYNSDPLVCPDDDNRGVPNGPDRLYSLASVTKSITSTLVGFALTDKLPGPDSGFDPQALEYPVDKYVQELGITQAKGGYAGVPVDRLLRMRSGAKYRESGWRNDADRLYREVVDNNSRDKSFLDFARTIKPRAGGIGSFNYAGMDTVVIGLLVEQLIGGGEHLSGYLERKIWQPLGMAHDAIWKIDLAGTPTAYCCFGVSIPDLARFGQFVLAGGKNRQGAQLLPRQWFELATQRRPRVDDAIPQDNPSYNRGCPLDYHFQWWAFKQPRHDFTAVGIAGQFVHIMPEEGVVIVQISNWGAWENGDKRECESFRAHDAIAAALRR